MALPPQLVALAILSSRTFSFVPPCDQPDISNLTTPKCHSCEGSCGRIWDQSSFYDTRCSCDFLCYFYQNCCYDFPEECPAELKKYDRWKASMKQGLPDPPKCVNIRTGLGRSARFSLVSSCKGDEQVCTRISHDLTSYVPIFDKGTGINYINLKCASCNGVRRTKMTPWRINCTCLGEYKDKGLVQVDPSEKEKRTMVQEVLKSESFSTAEYNLVFIPQDATKQIRYCYYDSMQSISVCPETCRNTELKQKCIEPYTAYVHVGKLKTYKNPYCALCNENEKLSRPQKSPQCGIIETFGCFGKFGRSISFPLTFDFNLKDGIKLENYRSTRPPCPDGHHWLHHQCRKTLQPTFNKVEMPSSFCVDSRHVMQRLEEIVRNVTIHEVTVSLRNCTGSYLSIAIRIPWNNAVRFQLTVLQVLRELFNATLQEYGTIKNFDLPIDIINCTYFQLHISEVLILENGTLILNRTGTVITDFRFVNDSVFVCLSVDEPPDLATLTPLNWLTWVLILLSLGALCVRILFHFLLMEFQNPVGRAQTSLAVSVLLALLSFLVSSVMPLRATIFTYPGCYIAGIFMHWAFLAMFTWMSVISVDIMRMLWQSSKCLMVRYGPRQFLYLSILAWLTPTVLVNLSIVVNHTATDDRFRPQYGRRFCWFNQRYALIIYFVVPVSLSILINMIMFMLSVILLCRSRSQTRMVEGRDSYDVALYLKLFVFMGITWGLGFVTGIVRSEVVDYIYVFLNASQGFLFTIGSLCTSNIRKLVREKVYSNSLSTTVSSTTVSTGKGPLERTALQCEETRL